MRCAAPRFSARRSSPPRRHRDRRRAARRAAPPGDRPQAARAVAPEDRRRGALLHPGGCTGPRPAPSCRSPAPSSPARTRRWRCGNGPPVASAPARPRRVTAIAAPRRPGLASPLRLDRASRLRPGAGLSRGALDAPDEKNRNRPSASTCAPSPRPACRPPARGLRPRQDTEAQCVSLYLRLLKARHDQG